jgi:16S rRNA processing protein RimM
MTAEPRQTLPVGRVGRPHGLDGSFYVTGARARLLTVGTRVTVGATEAAIVRRSGTEARPIVRLEGIEDRAAARGLRGRELTVEAAQAPSLQEGEWWAHELEGCEVFDGDRRVGSVTRLLELPSCEALEVLSEQGGEPLLVPMVKDAIRGVEIERRRIDVDLEFLGLERSQVGPRAGQPAAGSKRLNR